MRELVGNAIGGSVLPASALKNRAAVRVTILAVVAFVTATSDRLSVRLRAADPGCGPTGNPITCENSLTGDNDWDISPQPFGQVGISPKSSPYDASPYEAFDTDLEGFATSMSVNHGETIQFKIKSSDAY